MERYKMDWSSYHERARTGPCFVCQIIARHADFPADIIYEDDVAIAFLDKYPRVAGYTLVAPRSHRQDVTADFTPTQYVELQRRLHLVAEAVRVETAAERIDILRETPDERAELAARLRDRIGPRPMGPGATGSHPPPALARRPKSPSS